MRRSKLALGGVLTLVLLGGCRRDAFECGTSVGGTTLECNGANEVCLCAEHRCAALDPDACPDSLYRYVFEDGERCVPQSSLQSPIISVGTGNTAGLCPDQQVIPPVCGVEVSGQVAICPGADQTCLCDLNVCATFSRTDACPTGWRRAEDGACIDVSAVDTNLRVDTSSKQCPGTSVPEPEFPCGKPNLAGAITDCETGQTCVCGTNQCAVAAPEACAHSGLRYVSGEANAPVRCVQIEDARGERVQAGACLRFRPPRIPCGGLVEGNVDCPKTDQVCICGEASCAEPAPAGQCTDSNLRFVGTAECVSAADAATQVDGGLCAPTCGALDARGRVVNCPFGSCYCTAEGGRCAAPEPACPSNLAFTSDGRCLTYSSTSAAQKISVGETCPAEPRDTPCGGAGEDGRLAECTGAVCLCEAGVGRCAREQPLCPSGRAFTPTQRCAPEPDEVTVSEAEGVLCPGAAPAPPISCGGVGTSGRILGCAGGETCYCSSEGGQCAKSEPTCLYRFAGAHDGVCLQPTADDFLVPADTTSGLCPRAAEPTECGANVPTECGVDPCLCREGGADVCIVAAPACPDGLAEKGTGRCVVVGAEDTQVTSGACPGAAADGGQ